MGELGELGGFYHELIHILSPLNETCQMRLKVLSVEIMLWIFKQAGSGKCIAPHQNRTSLILDETWRANAFINFGGQQNSDVKGSSMQRCKCGLGRDREGVRRFGPSPPPRAPSAAALQAARDVKLAVRFIYFVYFKVSFCLPFTIVQWF